MIKHSLVCLVQGSKDYSFKALRLSSKPDSIKINEVYQANILTLNRLIAYCHQNTIKSLRITSSLFPLSSHAEHRDTGFKAIEEALQLFNHVDLGDINLSMHPDQFILLSSLNPHVNAQSRYDLELVAHIARTIKLSLINIHVGSKAQGESIHREIFKKEVQLLNNETQNLISIENDEKSYDFLTTLNIAQENGLMIVPDFHHERCYQRRNSQYTTNNHEIDKAIYDNISDVIDCYKGKQSLPTFHISSPSCGWNGKFKDECAHADYIAIEDYPYLLQDYSAQYKTDFVLDIEAKHKQLAILQLENSLKN